MSRPGDPAIFSKYRAPIVAFTSALALAAASAAGGSLWAPAQPTTAEIGVMAGARLTALRGGDVPSGAGRELRAALLAEARVRTVPSVDDPQLVARPAATAPLSSALLSNRTLASAEAATEQQLRGFGRQARTTESTLVSDRGSRPDLASHARSEQSVESGVRRAVPLVLHERGTETHVLTSAETLDEGLRSVDAELQEGDHVVPSLDTPVSSGLHVYLRRAALVSLDLGGADMEMRTLSGTVAELLAEQGIALGDEDRVEPALDAPLEPEMRISIVRVERETVEEEESLDFTVERRADPTLEIGRQRIEPGQEGRLRRTVEIVRENGNEVARTTVDEWMESEPQTGVVYYGTRRELRELDAPEGELRYARTMDVYATWYNASHGGKPPSSPWYGITATGMRAGRGVIAVDPTVIPYYTRVYVPGYGVAIAGDTGGGVKGAHIDLGFEEGEIPSWRSGWVTIYILE